MYSYLVSFMLLDINAELSCREQFPSGWDFYQVKCILFYILFVNFERANQVVFFFK